MLRSRNQRAPPPPPCLAFPSDHRGHGDDDRDGDNLISMTVMTMNDGGNLHDDHLQDHDDYDDNLYDDYDQDKPPLLFQCPDARPRCRCCKFKCW